MITRRPMIRVRPSHRHPTQRTAIAAAAASARRLSNWLIQASSSNNSGAAGAADGPTAAGHRRRCIMGRRHALSHAVPARPALVLPRHGRLRSHVNDQYSAATT